MAQSVVIAGAEYNSVPAVDLLTPGGGTARFMDTSPATATAQDILQGKTAYVNGVLLSGTFNPPMISPYYYDLNTGYIDNGTWIWQDPTNTYCDVYHVAASHTYVIKQVTWGSRFRVMFTTVDVTQVTSGRITGVSIYNKNSPTGTETATYTPAEDGYIVVAKDNVGVSGLVTTCTDTTIGDSMVPYPKMSTKTITVNGIYRPANDNLDGYSLVTVNVSGGGGGATLIAKNITANGTFYAADDSADGYSQVTVNLPVGQKSITSNGTYQAANDNLAGYNAVVVNVPGPDLGSKIISANGTYSANSDSLDGYSQVTVNLPLASKAITSNGTYNAVNDSQAGYSQVIVNVPTPVLSAKNITANGTYQASAENLDGYSQVVVNVPTPTPSLASITITTNGTYNASTESLDGYSQVVVDVAGGSGDIDKLIQKTITNIYNSTCSEIARYAFYMCTLLEEAAFPNCVSIGSNAFNYCYSLSIVSFPQCTHIGNHAFSRCSNLTVASFPACLVVGSCAFYYCENLAAVSMPLCTYISQSAFWNCDVLSEVNFPSTSRVLGGAFMYCSSLSSVLLPECNLVGVSTFANCTRLPRISFPKLSIISASAFYGCTQLSEFILLTSQCSLANSSVFANTPISNSTYLGYFGSIYVPSSLVTAYKTAANWSYYSSRITSYIES